MPPLEQPATANSRSGFEAWMFGMEATDGIAMMIGVHVGEKVGGGFVVRLGLLAAPVHEQAVGKTAKHANDQHRMRPTDSAEVVVMGDIEALMQAGFDAPGGAIEAEPLLGAQFFGWQAGDQGHRFGAMVSQVPVQ
jgi:hypothetical protein